MALETGCTKITRTSVRGILGGWTRIWQPKKAGRSRCASYRQRMLKSGRTTGPRLRVWGAILSLVAGGLLFVAAPGARASVPLSAVQNLEAVLTGDTAQVSWLAPAAGQAARYQIQAFVDGAYFGTRLSTTPGLTWDHIPFGHSVYFTVVPIGPDGANASTGPTGPVNQTTAIASENTYCPNAGSSDCVVVDSGRPEGTETLPGAGLLHGTVPPGNAYASLLHILHWRISSGNSQEFQDTQAYVPSKDIIDVLSDGWYTATRSCPLLGGTCTAADPWSNWTTYTNWVANQVRQVEATGANPFWEIQGEPEGYPYSKSAPPNRTRVEDEYLYAYEAIKSVDPAARVIGPSINWMYEYSYWPIDMKTFIPFAAANNMKLYALSWHENGADTLTSNPTYQDTPAVIRDEAEEARTLIAENPGIGNPVLFVDENSSAAGLFSPGWEAGYLAEEDLAGLAMAGRSCWPYPGEESDGCYSPNLSQLLDPNGLPLASFWTMADYTSMAGERVWSNGTDLNLDSLAATSSSGVTSILLGSHQTCSYSTATGEYCGQTSAAPPRSTTVNVLVPQAATTAQVSVQEIPDESGAVPDAPPTTTTVQTVTNGLVSITIPAFQDGESYFLTIDPSASTGTFPSDGNVATQTFPASGAPEVTQLIPQSPDVQSTTIMNSFSQPMTLLVTDQYGNPVAGQPVTFIVPSGYASFPSTGSSRATVVTTAYGIAQSPPIRAGGSSGNFSAGAYPNGPTDPTGQSRAWFGLDIRL